MIKMFWHNLKYTFKIILKNKALVFWTFLFPIILGTFFYLAFQDIEKNEKLDIIDIAIIENDTWKKSETFQDTFQSLEQGDDALFHITYTDETKAKEMLEQGDISGIVALGEEKEIIVKESGINETVLKYVIEEIKQTETIITNVIQEEMQKENENIEQLLPNIISHVTTMQKESEEFIEDNSSSNLSYTMIEFYTLIAMTCLYGGVLGLTAVHQKLANMSAEGKRVAVSPETKGSMILSSVIASFVVQCIGIFLLFVYTIFVLHVDYGNNFPLIILLTLVGCLAGLSLGIFLASVLKTSENNKTGILLTITMLGCFFSGMMGITMKYIVDKNIPIINQLNPANFITDGFYSLYYYETKTRFYHNVTALLLFSVILLILSIIGLRRQKYDNI